VSLDIEAPKIYGIATVAPATGTAVED